MNFKKFRQRKIILLLIILYILLVPSPISGDTGGETTAEEQMEDELDQIMDQPEIDQLRDHWEELDQEMSEYIPDLSFRDLFYMIVGEEEGFSLAQVFSGLLQFFLHEVIVNFRLLGKVIVLTVIAALLTALQGAFANEKVARLAHTVIYFAVVIIALQSFYLAVDIGREAVSSMVDIILAMVPLLLTLLASMGAVTTVAIFHPISIFLINTFSTLINNVIFPLLLFSAVLSVISHLNPKFKVSSLAGLFQNISITAIGFFLTIFIGIMGLQGVGGAVADGISIRAAKFLTGSFIPVIGKALSDAVETVMGASLVLTNSVTMAGAIILFFVTIFPALKILALVFVYKLAASLLEPLGETSIPESLGTMSKCLTWVFAGVATVSIMFFIAMAAIVGAANVSMMIRG
ncbi:stage III sporulation protein AE [Natranaerobius thermophilus]|uniref:Stage III sporulation protein AE n=1 Tax=Natranaerobius thermophilus (strain ATCC BAA-1301 / DSM 18059 / JW/NM-WN-LF) TaxID=457570 RepID=B2A541_NATTJ|nr:stage III sporulation protein AE [Natranaerobius thermophilus]ACB85283.1 stage III sporulation protein AE [Natranaerobius thermophilus JW/NM-WN-LF]